MVAGIAPAAPNPDRRRGRRLCRAQPRAPGSGKRQGDSTIPHRRISSVAPRIRTASRPHPLVWLAATLLAGASVSAGAASAAAESRGPFLLVTLPSLGAVSWSCGGARDRQVGLSFRVSADAATTTTEFLAVAHVARRARLQPGQSVRFPLLAPGQQRLVIVQGTEARTLHATVIATFNRSQSYCFPYFPPRLSVTLWQGQR
jgi:hypothetical protein